MDRKAEKLLVEWTVERSPLALPARQDLLARFAKGAPALEVLSAEELARHPALRSRLAEATDTALHLGVLAAPEAEQVFAHLEAVGWRREQASTYQPHLHVPDRDPADVPTQDARQPGPEIVFPHAVAPPPPPMHIGRYKIEEAIGVGSSGNIYRVADQRTGELRALKIIRTYSGAFQQRFRREIAVLAGLSHPHILRFVCALDAGPGAIGLIMELATGRTLGSLMAEGPLPPDTAAGYLLEICSGLGHLHERGIVHRDLKPTNLLLGTDGKLKIADFGLVKLREARDDVIPGASTSTGAMLGTIFYMAPEQFADAKHVTPQADLFSVGLIGFEMLAGRRAIGGKSFREVGAMLDTCAFPDLTGVAPGVDAELAGIVARLLRREPTERWESATALAAAIENWRKNRRTE